MFLPASERELNEERIAKRVATLSAQIHALTTELIDAVAEVDPVDASYGWGARSVGHWLSITGSWTMPEAQRIARVALKRAELGPIYEMASRGEVPVPVLDSVAKIITPENTETVRNIVATCTPSQTQRVLSKFRQISPSPNAEPSPDAEPAPTPPAPDYWWRQWTDELGRGRFDAALSPLATELLGEAYAAAARSIQNERDSDDPGVDERNDDASAEASSSTEPSVGGVADPARERTSEPSRRRWYPPRNGPDADEAARRLAEAMLSEAARNGVRRTGGEPFAVLVTVDLETLLESLGLSPSHQGPFKVGSQCFTRSGRRLSTSELAEALRTSTLQTVVTAEGVPLWMGNERRFASKDQRRALNIRGNGCCEIPGCTNTLDLVAHHVTFYGTRNGPTSLCNLMHLCGPHHRQLHAEQWSVTTEPGSQRFTIRTASGRCLGSNHPDGPPPDLAHIADGDPSPPPRLHLAPDATEKHGGGAPLTRYALDVFVSSLLAS